MAIPFLWELRAILDWTVETTPLTPPVHTSCSHLSVHTSCSHLCAHPPHHSSSLQVETTSLTLFAWLKVEDIYAGLCAVRADMASRRRYVRGKKQPLLDRVTQGCLFTTVLLVIVLGPLLLFSNANPITNSHLVKSATRTVTAVHK